MRSTYCCLLFVSFQCALSFAPNLCAQRLLAANGIGGRVNLFQNDLAIFEAGEARKDLVCTVTPRKPLLGFDLRFHSGYEVTIPMSELEGPENLLTMVFRVTSQDHPKDTQYFIQKIRVPEMAEGAKGSAFLQGIFDVGEGSYKVEWLMRDRLERVCSDSWEVEAALPVKDKAIAVALPAGSISPAEWEQFKEEPPVSRQTEKPLNIKVLLNFAPQNSGSASMQPLDASALVSILRTLSRDPHIGKFSIVAFNLQERRVVYRQEDAPRINFPALGEALQSIHLGVVDLKALKEKNGETEFLADFIKKEVSEGKPDALVFAGPKAMLEEGIRQEDLKQIGELSYPVFYMNYNLSPQAMPWRDSIGNAVKYFKGQEYTISRPRDLWYAVNEMVSRVVKLRQAKNPAPSSAE